MRRILCLAVLTLLASGAQAETVELAYDDGSAEANIVLSRGGAHAVRFTPSAYPALLDAVRFHAFVGDSACSGQHVWILDDDGPSGAPGTTLYGPVTFAAQPDVVWNEASLSGAGLVIEAGEFFVAFLQPLEGPVCSALNLDLNSAAGRHWSLSGGVWEEEIEFANPMIRIVVETEPVPVTPITWGTLKLGRAH